MVVNRGSVVPKLDLQELMRVYRQNQNVSEHIRKKEGSNFNSTENILHSYDLQAGSYIDALNDEKHLQFKVGHSTHLAEIINNYEFKSILDVGVGEATIMPFFLKKLANKAAKILAFDISLSRVLYARKLVNQVTDRTIKLFTARIDAIPLPNASVDLVFTSHALEPNHGQELKLLSELLRVTRNQLIMVEPTYELGNRKTRRRIEKLCYIRDLPDHLDKLGYKVDRHEKWPWIDHPANEAALIIVSKQSCPPINPNFISPMSRLPMQKRDGYFYCPGDGYAFPIVEGVPCLVPENGILVSKLDDIIRERDFYG